MPTASSNADSVQMTGTTRFLVRMPISSMEMTSSGLVIATTRLPLSSMLSGMSRRRTMKSRGSSPSAAGWGVVWVRSTTPMCIWPATAAHDVVVADKAVGDEHLTEAPAAVVLACERLVELRLRDEAARDQQVAQLEPTVDAPLTAADQRVELGS